jgi:hypothetical protein
VEQQRFGIGHASIAEGRWFRTKSFDTDDIVRAVDGLRHRRAVVGAHDEGHGTDFAGWDCVERNLTTPRS